MGSSDTHYTCNFCGTFLKREGDPSFSGKDGWVCQNPRCEATSVITYPDLIPSESRVAGVTKVIKGLDPTLYKRVRKLAIDRSKTVAEVLNDAMMLLLAEVKS